MIHGKSSKIISPLNPNPISIGLRQELNRAMGVGGVVQFKAYHGRLGQRGGYWLCQMKDFLGFSCPHTLWG